MWSHSFSLSVLFLVFISLVAPVLAQTSKIFQWQFANNALSTSLATCLPMPISIKPFNATLNDTIGLPPYYMIAFAIGGTPVTTFIGSDKSSLSWQVTHPVGTKLLLSVVDASGSAGGIPPSLFTVIAGPTTQCVNDPSSEGFTVIANVTDTLTTCQPWGITVKGGVPPYNLTLAAINSPIVTNVTMPFGNDVFTYIDRADPNTQLMAAISDLTGRWATGTPIVKTQGSTDVDCVGLVSSSGNSTEIQQQADAAKAQSKKKTSIIAGVCATLGILLLVAGGVVTFLYIRRRRQQEARENPDLTPHQFEESGGELLPFNNFISLSSHSKNAYRGAYTLASRSDLEASNAHPSAYYSDSSTTHWLQGGSSPDDRRQSDVSNNFGQPGFTGFSLTPVRRSGKVAEAGVVLLSPDSEHTMSDTGSGMSRQPRPPNSPLTPAHFDGDRPIIGGEPVFQHQDAGGVRELPPPYADRGGVDPAS